MHGLLNLILCALVAATTSDAPAWTNDYGAALEQTKATGVPLLVILDASPRSGESLVRPAAAFELTTRDDESRLLEEYVVCRVNVETDYGRQVADAFHATSFPHTVIIDRTGSTKIFKKTGEFERGEWIETLSEYRDGVARQTAVREPVVCFT